MKLEELENKINVLEVEESGQSITSNTVVKQQESYHLPAEPQ